MLTMGENPNEEDFGYCYNSHKGLHWLQIDLLNIVDKEIHVCIRRIEILKMMN